MNEIEIARYAAAMNRTAVELREEEWAPELTGIADFHEPVDSDEWPPSGDFSPHAAAPWWRGIWASPAPKPWSREIVFADSAFTNWRSPDVLHSNLIPATLKDVALATAETGVFDWRVRRRAFDPARPPATPETAEEEPDGETRHEEDHRRRPLKAAHRRYLTTA